MGVKPNMVVTHIGAGSGRRAASRGLSWALCAACLLALVACQTETRVVRGGWGEWAQTVGAETYRDRPNAGGNASQPGDTSPGQVTILLAELEGSSRHRKAKDLVKQVRTLAERQDAWSIDNGKSTRVYVGHYGVSGHSVAMQDAERLRGIAKGDDRPFAAAEVMTLGEQDSGLRPHDLRRHVGMYSLQIGFYDENFGGDFRKACETAVEVLRKEGTPAYFYHGPFRSLLCVGVFTETDFDDSTGVRRYGPTITQWRDKYPYNLANGVTMIEKTKRGESLGAQPSFLVRVF